LNAAAAVVLYLWYIWFPYARKRWEAANAVAAAATNARLRKTPDRYYAPEDEETELTPIERCIFTLGDANLVTAIAIMISSMYKSIPHPNYPLYHMFIARSLATIALLGHNSTGPVYALLRKKHEWSIRIRWVLSVVSILLYLVWSLYALTRFWKLERHWKQDDLAFTPACLSAHRSKLVPFSFSFWIIINFFWMPIGFGNILVSPFAGTRGAVNKGIRKIDECTFKCIYSLYKRKGDLMPRDGPTWKKVGLCVGRLLTLALKIGGVLLWFIVQLLFIPVDALQPINTLVLGLAWAVYDVLTIKLSNWNTVVDALDAPSLAERSNPESDYGIGQVFPIVMFLQVILAVLDAMAGKWFIPRFKLCHLQRITADSLPPPQTVSIRLNKGQIRLVRRRS
jgi:hypothetical protein